MHVDLTRKALTRIVGLSATVALFASIAAWHIAVEHAESDAVYLTVEATKKSLSQNRLKHQNVPSIHNIAEQLTQSWFDIVEIYDIEGNKVAHAQSSIGERLEMQLPAQELMPRAEPGYESFHFNDTWVLRAFVPLHEEHSSLGYVEGVRSIPTWQQNKIQAYALWTALLAGCSALVCGLAIYPIVSRLNRAGLEHTLALKSANINMLITLGNAIALRDSDTGVHNYRVTWMATVFAEHLSLKPTTIRPLILGSFLHDVGKIAISDNILLKPDRLSDIEMALMKTHVTEGIKMIQDIEWLQPAKPVIVAHHEKWDGSGYPYGLSKYDIPLIARIFSIIDVFDALCSSRPYKQSFTYDKAVEILIEGRGKHFDPDLLDVFIPLSERLYNESRYVDEQVMESMMKRKVDDYF